MITGTFQWEDQEGPVGIRFTLDFQNKEEMNMWIKLKNEDELLRQKEYNQIMCVNFKERK
jgi:hypothetical protein